VFHRQRNRGQQCTAHELPNSWSQKKEGRSGVVCSAASAKDQGYRQSEKKDDAESPPFRAPAVKRNHHYREENIKLFFHGQGPGMQQRLLARQSAEISQRVILPAEEQVADKHRHGQEAIAEIQKIIRIQENGGRENTPQRQIEECRKNPANTPFIKRNQ
jgi:hypothetical protein